MAEQRKKEISIRKVLAFPIGYVIINKWLSSFDYRVGISALPFILASTLSLVIALLTVSIQSVKVARANPVDALRSE